MLSGRLAGCTASAVRGAADTPAPRRRCCAPLPSRRADVPPDAGAAAAWHGRQLAALAQRLDEIGGRRQIGDIGEAHQHHLGGLQRRRRDLHLAEPLQQHLPGAGQRRHARASAASGRPRGAIALDHRIALAGARRELEAGQEMRELEQILQHHHRVGAAVVERRHLVERRRRIAAQHRFEQVEEQAAVGDAEHVAHRLARRWRRRPARSPGRAATARRAPSRRRRGRSARSRPARRRRPRPRRSARNARVSCSIGTRRSEKRWQRDSTVIGTLLISVVAKMNLTSGGGSSSVFNSALKAVLREHVHFVDDVDLEARRDRLVADAVGQLADVVDAGARGGIHLDHVDMAVLGDRRGNARRRRTA